MSVRFNVLHVCVALFITVLAAARVEGAVHNAASCAKSAVDSAISAAVSGDIVAVPAGTCTWPSSVDLPATKDLTLQGAGIDVTVITCSSGICVRSVNSATSRITGFTFLEGNVQFEGPATTVGKMFRLDHNKFTSNSVWRVIEVSGGAPAGHPTGLVDNNEFRNYAVHVNGTNQSFGDGPEQHQLWAQNVPIGSGPGVVYVESNTFFGTTHQNAVDGNYGARFVFRFNSLSGMTYVEIHSVQGANRAVQLWELYDNSFGKSQSDWYPLAMVRGGTGVIFGNRLTANYTSDIILNNVRSCRDPGDGVGKCNGTSNWDQNGTNGYACRDQIGRGRDTAQWSPGGAYSQPLTPAYFWDNVKGASTEVSVIVEAGEPCPGAGGDLNAAHLATNRDWYTYDAGFNGTVGVGIGTLAGRPPTCTVGVGYWATDQGEWNSNQAGPDGQLYKCTAANTWSLHYRPYPYPHPLTVLSGAPSAPKNLRIVP